MSEPPKNAIRDAATVILLREGAAGPEVLLVRRSRGAAFMADAHVFPGGRIEAGDRGDFALAAAREAFEEAGVLVAVDEKGDPVSGLDAPWVEEARLAVQRGQRDFVATLAEAGLSPDTSGFVHFARWVTPPTEARRFDARFFLARVPPEQTALPDPAAEVIDFRWDTPAHFLAMQARGEIKLPPPTLWHLTDLSRHTTVEESLAWARARAARVITVRPKLLPLDGVLTILLPWDRDYAAAPVDEGEPLAADSPVAGPITRYELVGGRWVGRSR